MYPKERRACPSSTAPSKETVPPCAPSTPKMMRIVVVFPAPLPPTKPVSLPRSTLKVTSLSTWWSPKYRSTPCTCNIGHLVDRLRAPGVPVTTFDARRPGVRSASGARGIFVLRPVGEDSSPVQANQCPSRPAGSCPISPAGRSVSQAVLVGVGHGLHPVSQVQVHPHVGH